MERGFARPGVDLGADSSADFIFERRGILGGLAWPRLVRIRSRNRFPVSGSRFPVRSPTQMTSEVTSVTSDVTSDRNFRKRRQKGSPKLRLVFGFDCSLDSRSFTDTFVHRYAAVGPVWFVCAIYANRCLRRCVSCWLSSGS